jgi:hypothetical protein
MSNVKLIQIFEQIINLDTVRGSIAIIDNWLRLYHIVNKIFLYILNIAF